MSRSGLSIVLGAVVGLGLGLLYAWVVSPVQYTDTAPASLRADYRLAYIHIVAKAYVVEGDLDRAAARLRALGEANPAQALTALAQQAAAAGEDARTVRALAALASALGARPVASASGAAPTSVLAVTAEPPEATLASPPSATPFLLPTRTPTATPLGAFDFVGKQLVCDPALQPPLIQALMLDATGGQVPGVEVVVEWDGGFDHFFTGLKPELGAGYGDFAMTEGVSYTVHLPSNPAAAITGLAVEPCAEAGRQYSGSWRLVFRQP